jgi:hypothetical protein
MKIIFLIPFIFLFQLNLAGQAYSGIKVDPATVPGIKENRQASEYKINDIRNLYYASVSSPYEFINGKEYVHYYYRGKTTPMLFSGQSFQSSLYFGNRKYDNIKLQYDTFLDQVVYTDTSKMVNSHYSMISLSNDYIEGFSIIHNNETMNFRYLKFPADAKNYPPDGFYELAYDGPSTLIIRHRSVQYNKDAINEYEYSPENWVWLGGSFRKVGKTKDFVLMFGQNTDAVKRFIHENRIKIRKAPKQNITNILKYYDSINH